jgi:hypothetical protein
MSRHAKLRKGASRTLKLLKPAQRRHPSVTPVIVYTRDLGKEETKSGPTLRIFDGADRLLLGRDHPQRSSSIVRLPDPDPVDDSQIWSGKEEEQTGSGDSSNFEANNTSPEDATIDANNTRPEDATIDAMQLCQSKANEELNRNTVPVLSPLEVTNNQERVGAVHEDSPALHSRSNSAVKPSRIPIRPKVSNSALATAEQDVRAELKIDSSQLEGAKSATDLSAAGGAGNEDSPSLLDRAQSAIKLVQGANRRVQALMEKEPSEKVTVELFEMAEVCVHLLSTDWGSKCG